MGWGKPPVRAPEGSKFGAGIQVQGLQYRYVATAL